MGRVVRLCAALAAAALGCAAPASADFHQMSISEVGAGFLGDPNVQFVELRLDAGGQTGLGDTRLTVFDKDGVPTLLLLSAHDVADGTSGRNVLYATAAFQTATGITPDFVIPAGVVGPKGMICWGAPGTTTPPDPTSWDFDKPNNYADCVAYGAYDHPTRLASGTPTSLAPGDGTQSLTRTKNTGATGSNDADFALAAASPCNNANQCADLVPSPSATPTPVTPVAKGQIICRRAVIKAGAKFATAAIQAHRGCETQRLRGKAAGSCPDAKAAEKIAAADGKRTRAILKACGALTASDAGFGSACPGYTGSCTAPITSIADVSGCIDCAARRAGDEIDAAIYGAPPDPTQLKCQLGFGNAVTLHHRALLSLLTRCEDRVARGKLAPPCPDPKTAGKIAAKNAKLLSTVCKACGGEDRRCDGRGDATAATLGLTTCPARVVPGGRDCGSLTIGSLADVGACVQCLSSFTTTCTTALLAHPDAVPAECSATP